MQNMNEITGNAFMKLVVLCGIAMLLASSFFGTFLSILIYVGSK